MNAPSIVAALLEDEAPQLWAVCNSSNLDPSEHHSFHIFRSKEKALQNIALSMAGLWALTAYSRCQHRPVTWGKTAITLNIPEEEVMTREELVKSIIPIIKCTGSCPLPFTTRSSTKSRRRITRQDSATQRPPKAGYASKSKVIRRPSRSSTKS